MAKLILAGVLCLMAAACAPHPAQPGSDYRTVAKDPRRDTDAARAENERALELMSKDDLKGAEAALKRALAADVMFGPAHNNLGLVYYRQNQLYMAAWEFQYAVKLMPSQPEPKNNLGLVFEAGGKLDQAIDSYSGAMKLGPDEPQFVGNLARARVRRGEQGPEVRELLEKVAAIDTRPEWIAWARERLALMRHGTAN